MSTPQARAYVGKAEEYLSAAMAELAADRPIAATSLPIHAALDDVTPMRAPTAVVGKAHERGVRSASAKYVSKRHGVAAVELSRCPSYPSSVVESD